MDEFEPAVDVEPTRPGLIAHLKIRPVSVGDGAARVEMTVGPEHLRSRGIAHGGVIATLLDTTMGRAVGSKAGVGSDLVTAQLNVHFVRPARLGDTLVSTAMVEHSGRRTAVARGEIRSAEGRLVATATATFLYINIEG